MDKFSFNLDRLSYQFIVQKCITERINILQFIPDKGLEYTLSLTLNKIILEIRICLVIFTVTKELFHIHVSKETGTCSTWNRSEATMIYGINRVLLKITISRIKTVHVMCKQKNDSHSCNLKIYNLSTANMYKKTHTSRFAPWTSFFLYMYFKMT